MRRENSLEKSIMLGMGGGSRKRGRPRARWLDDIKAVTNCGNLYLSWPKLFNTFSHILTSFVLHKCIHSIITHQYMYKLYILMQNCDFESTLNAINVCSRVEMCERY